MDNTFGNQITAQILKHETFDGRGFTTNNSLAEARITKADTLTPVITHLMGNDSKKFPLTFLTEGQAGGMRTIGIEDIEYDYPVMTRLKQSDVIVSHEYTAATEVGKRGVPFHVIFKTNWLKDQHLVRTPNGKIARILSKERVSTGFRYTFQLIYRNLDDYMPTTEMTAGLRWSMSGGAPVAEAYSSGNESNKQVPGKLKNQISILRKSYEFGGNVSNRTVEFQFNLPSGKTSYWMPFEEYQHELQYKEACEEHLWESTYNRDVNGNITTIDPETGFPIPIGAGVDDQIPNKDTYGFLTVGKLSRTVGDVLYGATDTGRMEIVLFTGVGGAREFDAAIKRESTGAGAWTLTSSTDNKFIGGTANSNSLKYGAYFNQYQHIDGHTITVRLLNLLDYGGRAENSPLHPVEGLPMSSFDMYFVDMSTYDGIRNVQMVNQKGRSMIRGIEQGMTLIKGKSYGDYNGNATNINLATDIDKAAVHFLKTLGVNIRRNVHCFKLSCDLS
jgi:hypothetical protein